VQITVLRKAGEVIMTRKWSPKAVQAGREMIKAGPIATFSGKYNPKACPLCGHDHQENSKHLTPPLCDCDYEECGECGFDHEYELAEATTAHKLLVGSEMVGE
jgi:hypothetical protein